MRTCALWAPPLLPSLARLWQQDIRLDARRAGQTLGLAWTPWRATLQSEAVTPSALELALRRAERPEAE